MLLVAGAQGSRARDVTPARSEADLLPDLDQETPTQLVVESDGSTPKPGYWLGFRSAVRNVGDGPLILDGSRSNTTTPFMSVTQVIERADGSERVVPGVGRMVYVASPSHSHWHYLQFDRYELERYELRRVKSARPLVADRKTGFCLGDRYRVTTRPVPHAAPDKVYRDRCGLTETGLLQLREGISVGYGDDYGAFLEGQDLPLTGLRGGRYVLVHRVNGNRHLRESSYVNDAASVLFDLRWRNGMPYLRVLRSCPDSARCAIRPLGSVDPIRTREISPAAAAVAHAAGPFFPNDTGVLGQPGAWDQVQWNLVGPYGVDAPAAWGNLIADRRPGGTGVTVAVLDTGIAYADQPPYRRSPDLAAGTFTPGYDFVDDDTSPFDLNGHGTHVASTIAEQTNNGYGLTGLAYGVRIMPVRVLDAAGNGYPDRIAAGIRYAVDHHAKVINMSLNFGPDVTAGQIPQVLGAIDYAYKRGVVVIAAAGNDGIGQVAYPARSTHALAVGATTENGCLSSFSNSGDGIDLVAPGGGSDANLVGDPNCHAGRAGKPIYQMTFLGGRVTDFAPAVDFIGTSMATAHVSAIAALAIASRAIGANPSPLLVARRLQRSSQDLGPTGYDTSYGWGLVNAAAATARGKARRPGSRRPPAGIVTARRPVLPAQYAEESSPG